MLDKYILPLVCTENSNPDVVMMKPAEDRVRTNDSGRLNRTRNRRILVQQPMRSDGGTIAVKKWPTTIYNRFVRWARRGIWENLCFQCECRLPRRTTMTLHLTEGWWGSRAAIVDSRVIPPSHLRT
jgi:hypothetical protein